jgi:serine/threonine protein kinase
MVMNAKVIRMADRRQDAMTPPLATPVSEPGAERVRRALANRFTAVKAHSGQGDVEYYVARDARGDVVQLRVLSARRMGDARARELFQLEANAASKLAHLNILGTGAPEEVNGVLFCVIEHNQAARTLRELVDNNGWLDARSAARIADQIASALGHAHQMGVLHLRLQPESVLVEPDGWVTVADFGLEAKHGSERLLAPRVPYASPEQTMRVGADHRSDLYSLGALLYEMLTDRTPFDSNDEDYVRQRQVEFHAAPPHLISIDVPESVSNVVMRSLERGPGKRFASATAFQAALDGAINSQ